jgi:NADPH:quinone reductase-like Zn-dependent oxidoreductase
MKTMIRNHPLWAATVSSAAVSREDIKAVTHGNMMQAVRFHAYGGPEQLILEDVPRPEVQPETVLVRVRAAGVNPVDWKFRRGLLKDYMPLSLPHIPGIDMAGVVDEIGPAVVGFAKGQQVYGRATSGTYAEYALAPVTSLAPKPDLLNFDEAAAVPIGAMTAWRALFEAAGLQKRQRILVHGAAGGVGSFAVQLARWKGARVIGTASAGNLEFVRSLGAQGAIDYQVLHFENMVRDMDVVLDTIGGDVLERSWQTLRPGGILISIAGQPSPDKAQEYGVRAMALGRSPILESELLRQIKEVIEAGYIKVDVPNVFSLSEAALAQAMSETGHGRGRIVLHVPE